MQDPSIPSITRNDAIANTNTNAILLNKLNNVFGGRGSRRRQRGGESEPIYVQSGTDITTVNANMATTSQMQQTNSNAFVNPVIKPLFGGRRRRRTKTRRKRRRRQRTRK